MTRKSIKGTVHGVVQGVCFRYYTRKTAQSLGVTGWVKNLPDGAVALEAFGDEKALRSLAVWLEKGPPSARVSRVEVEWCEGEADAGTFDILY